MNAPRITATLVRGAKIVVFCLAALAPLAPGSLQAQVAGGAPVVSAEILPPALSGAGSQPLEFGQVSLGQTVDVPPGAAGVGALTSSAGWRFGNIRKGRLLVVSLDLPGALQRGADAIPVDWDNANYASACLSRNGGACVWTSSYNPGATPWRLFFVPNGLPGNNFDLDLYVGARLVVPPGLPPGRYTATVTATIVHIG
ncbi:MAG: hypothetical protein AMXMBFR53_07560 [Gemmatimonadota bacterium]